MATEEETSPASHHSLIDHHHHHCPRWRLPSPAASFGLKTSLLSQLGGSVGDLGTYIPIVLALSLVNGLDLDLDTTLIFTAIYNVLTGLLFGVPMCVQPMKSIAAVAISESDRLTIPQIMAAGISTASVLFLLGATGLMSFFYRFIPLPVVRGVQLSQGLSFAFTAVKYVRYNQNLSSGKSAGPRPWPGLDGIVLALAALLFVVLSTGSGDTNDCHQNVETKEYQPPLADDIVVVPDLSPDESLPRCGSSFWVSYSASSVTRPSSITSSSAPPRLA